MPEPHILRHVPATPDARKDGMMKGGCLIGGIVAAILVVLIILGGMYFGRYNTMVQKDEQVKSAWSQVENVYQRRLELIPNLVETVKGVANFERETYTAVADARSRASQVQVTPEQLDDPEALRRFQQSQSELSGALGRLLVTVERYPELKANQNFLELQSQLEGTENRIAVERRRFNEVAQDFNTYIRTVPNNLVASIAGFKPKAYFEATEGAERAPKVQF
jgi:LemA protein